MCVPYSVSTKLSARCYWFIDLKVIRNAVSSYFYFYFGNEYNTTFLFSLDPLHLIKMQLILLTRYFMNKIIQ
jgi:hypothetical protein